MTPDVYVPDGAAGLIVAQAVILLVASWVFCWMVTR